MKRNLRRYFFAGHFYEDVIVDARNDFEANLVPPITKMFVYNKVVVIDNTIRKYAGRHDTYAMADEAMQAWMEVTNGNVKVNHYRSTPEHFMAVLIVNDHRRPGTQVPCIDHCSVLYVRNYRKVGETVFWYNPDRNYMRILPQDLVTIVKKICPLATTLHHIRGYQDLAEDSFCVEDVFVFIAECYVKDQSQNDIFTHGGAILKNSLEYDMNNGWEVNSLHSRRGKQPKAKQILPSSTLDCEEQMRVSYGVGITRGIGTGGTWQFKASPDVGVSTKRPHPPLQVVSPPAPPLLNPPPPPQAIAARLGVARMIRKAKKGRRSASAPAAPVP